MRQLELELEPQHAWNDLAPRSGGDSIGTSSAALFMMVLGMGVLLSRLNVRITQLREESGQILQQNQTLEQLAWDVIALKDAKDAKESELRHGSARRHLGAAKRFARNA